MSVKVDGNVESADPQHRDFGRSSWIATAITCMVSVSTSTAMLMVCWRRYLSCTFAMRNPPEIGNHNMFIVYLCLSFIYLLGAHRLSKCWWLAAQDLLVYPPCLSGSFCWRSGWLNPWIRHGPVGGQRSVKFPWKPLKPNMMIIYDYTHMCIYICYIISVCMIIWCWFCLPFETQYVTGLPTRPR